VSFKLFAVRISFAERPSFFAAPLGVTRFIQDPSFEPNPFHQQEFIP